MRNQIKLLILISCGAFFVLIVAKYFGPDKGSSITQKPTLSSAIKSKTPPSHPIEKTNIQYPPARAEDQESALSRAAAQLQSEISAKAALVKAAGDITVALATGDKSEIPECTLEAVTSTLHFFMQMAGVSKETYRLRNSKCSANKSAIEFEKLRKNNCESFSKMSEDIFCRVDFLNLGEAILCDIAVENRIAPDDLPDIKILHAVTISAAAYLPVDDEYVQTLADALETRDSQSPNIAKTLYKIEANKILKNKDNISTESRSRCLDLAQKAFGSSTHEMAIPDLMYICYEKGLLGQFADCETSIGTMHGRFMDSNPLENYMKAFVLEGKGQRQAALSELAISVRLIEHRYPANKVDTRYIKTLEILKNAPEDIPQVTAFDLLVFVGHSSLLDL